MFFLKFFSYKERAFEDARNFPKCPGMCLPRNLGKMKRLWFAHGFQRASLFSLGLRMKMFCFCSKIAGVLIHLKA